MNTEAVSLLTIGHSNHPFDYFISLLGTHRVTSVADVRSAPYSRRYPQFSRELLQKALNQHGITYVFLGEELGARPKDPSCYLDGRVQFRRLAQTELFRRGLERVLAEAESNCVAILCAEREPLACHRTILVARELVGLGAHVAHIHADGRLESHAEALERLLDDLKLRQLGLFSSSSDLSEQAYAEQEARIAYSPSAAPVADDAGEEG